ncbi:MAG: hypothetical protein HOH20_05130 [Rhodospirillaceae bacterium]|jgi:hypothetical protein|nr:hypothetical protein [Rhodospirillaceae bacterium]MBT5566225.1 hypothetical protein [Rhodospirillaceae bacterium]MBT6088943.1 hypothetical protein [Rhodospirillaceae bacterium]MBT6962431.1 hypothetical protein [Rhodospirillaceae bacterium]
MSRLFPLTLVAGLCIASTAVSGPAETDVDHWLSCRGLKLVTALNTALAPLPRWEPRQQHGQKAALIPMTIRVSTTPMPRLKTVPNL